MIYSKNYVAVPPGETIRELLEDKEMTQKEFAMRMDISEKHASNLINGKVQLTASIAQKLYYVLGPDASFWNNLEAQYRQDLELVKEENEIPDDLQYAQKIPYEALVEAGMIADTNSNKKKVYELRKLFAVSNLKILFEK
ncbi:MAG: helix-turn-helix domain-containing protein [Eubacteriales bacterium]|nr:helix-turn-helix domain-containing protein [Eubacteriales bacterium]